MRYAKMCEIDISNGVGVGTSLFVQGCPHHCKGCFNEETWSFVGGMEWKNETADKFLSLCERDYIERVTILGGEPYCMQNVETVARLCHDIKVRFPNMAIWVYTGYTIEEVIKNSYFALVNVDVLVDGKFEIDKKDYHYPYAGSRNQRVIDVQETLLHEHVVLYLSHYAI